MLFVEGRKGLIYVELQLICYVVLVCLALLNDNVRAAGADSTLTVKQKILLCLGNAIPQTFSDDLVFSDGKGLPLGSGMASRGELIFQRRCQNCHGHESMGATAVELVGGHNTLSQPFPVKAVGSYWLAAPTLLAYIQQAMPPQNSTMSEPRLNNDESYAIVAYILFLNGLWLSDALLNATQLAAIKMPNWNGFNDSTLAQQANTYQLASGCAE